MPHTGDSGVLLQIEKRLDRIEGLIGALTSLEYDHRNTKDGLHRAFEAIGKVEIRIATLEQSAPLTNMVRRWVLGLVYAALGVIGLALLSSVMPTVARLHSEIQSLK